MTELHVVSWNTGLRDAPLRILKGSGYDVALLQDTRLRICTELRPLESYRSRGGFSANTVFVDLPSAETRPCANGAAAKRPVPAAQLGGIVDAIQDLCNSIVKGREKLTFERALFDRLGCVAPVL